MKGKLAKAFALHQQGQLQAAMREYAGVLQLRPNDIDALAMSGVACVQCGEVALGVQRLEKAAVLAPGRANVWANLGEARRQALDLSGAKTAVERALSLDPDHADAWNTRGCIARDTKRFSDARPCFEQALRLMPRHFEAALNLAETLVDLHEFAAALAQAQIATTRGLKSPKLDYLQALALVELNRAAEAEKHAQVAVRAEPANAAYLDALATCLLRTGRPIDAVAMLKGAIDRFGRTAPRLDSFGTTLLVTGNVRMARDVFRQAVESEPNRPESLSHLTAALSRLGEWEDAITAATRLSRIPESAAVAHNNLGLLFAQTGRHTEACDAFRESLSRDPTDAGHHSNLLLELNYCDGSTGESLLAEHRAWASVHAVASLDAATTERDPARKLKVGYVSPDFRDHAVAYLLEPLLEHHDRNLFDVFCYSLVEQEDETTRRLRQYGHNWRESGHLSDDQLAHLIRDDGIDLLVDCAGHTSGNRLPVFARRPAPLQLSHFGYPGTTGLAQMDFRITDAVADPKGVSDAHYTERLVRLDRCAWCYRPPTEAAEVPATRPATGERFRFGSFNNLPKLSSSLLNAWGRILGHVPNAELVIVANGGPAQNQWLSDALTAAGARSEQVLISDRLPRAQFLQLIRSVDLALDSAPYTGGVTTFDTLWQCTPVLSMMGLRHAGRHSASIMTHAGLTDFLVQNMEQYVTKAVSLSHERSRLESLRNSLRTRLEEAGLTDGVEYARQIESAYRRIWREWCAG